MALLQQRFCLIAGVAILLVYAFLSHHYHHRQTTNIAAPDSDSTGSKSGGGGVPECPRCPVCDNHAETRAPCPIPEPCQCADDGSRSSLSLPDLTRGSSQRQMVELFRQFKLDVRLKGKSMQLREPAKDPWSHSHQNVARFVDKLLKGKRNGFYIEAGALDGEFWSNTLAFDLERNWTGLLAEPDPGPYRTLLNAHRKAFTTSACLSTENAIEYNTFYSSQVIGWSALAGEAKHGDQIQLRQVVDATCFPVAVMLDAINVSHVDYFSLDIEGPELKVLKTIPYDRIHFSVIVIETGPTNRQSIIDFLVSKNFKVVPLAVKEDVAFLHADDWLALGYASESYPRR